MNLLRRILGLSACLTVLTALVITVLALEAHSVSRYKVNQIRNGMKLDQVVALLGQPTRIDHAEITGLSGDVYYYLSDDGNAKVVLINGAVLSAGYIPGIKFL